MRCNFLDSCGAQLRLFASYNVFSITASFCLLMNESSSLSSNPSCLFTPKEKPTTSTTLPMHLNGSVQWEMAAESQTRWTVFAFSIFRMDLRHKLPRYLELETEDLYIILEKNKSEEYEDHSSTSSNRIVTSSGWVLGNPTPLLHYLRHLFFSCFHFFRSAARTSL